MHRINESEERSFVLLTNLYIKSFFQEADVASVTALSEYSHIFVEEPKNIQFIELLRTASGEMTDTATTSYPEFPLCLTAKPSNATRETNNTKQSNRCIHSCTSYSRRQYGKKYWLVNAKTPTALNGNTISPTTSSAI